MKRDSKEIKIKDVDLKRNNIHARIGAAKGKDNPKTIYLTINFWARPKVNLKNPKEEFEKLLESAINKSVNKKLNSNAIFPFPKKNISIINIPESFGSSDKKSFVSLDFYLHTINIHRPNSLALSKKNENPFLLETIELINELENQAIFSEKSKFEITKNK